MNMQNMEHMCAAPGCAGTRMPRRTSAILLFAGALSAAALLFHTAIARGIDLVFLLRGVRILAIAPASGTIRS
jgi:hypothetical protein